MALDREPSGRWMVVVVRSLSSTSQPKISRLPSAVTPVATTVATS